MQKIVRNPIFLGITFFAIQLFLILLICPEKTLSTAWLSLAFHWDSEWYEAIAQYGYINTSFPVRSGLQSANVVFFPGYPYLAHILILLFGLNAKTALLLVSQTTALFFWCLLFYILRSAQWVEQFAAALLIALFPSSWFLFMGYSESLFLLMCCLMLWVTTEKRWVLSGLSGILMTSTRLIGIPVLLAPLLAKFITQFSQLKSQLRSKNIAPILQEYGPFCLIILFGALGCIGFLIYCKIEFGLWHLYFDMERLFWKGTADPLFLFKLPTWVPPPFGYPADYVPPLYNAYAPLFIFDFFRLAAYSFSETLVPILTWTFVLFLFWIFTPPKQLDKTSLTWFLAALLLFLFTCFSLSTRYYESMSRCLFPVWVLLIISDVIHPERVFFFRSKRLVLTVTVVLYVFISGGFWLQLLNRFFIGWWVA